ncbi:HofP DNA utilization family protein [Dickeya poaceiphila]|uniref:DUF2531 family protein n=1 Tax=Dickeya poaceiphila TaxID=568768 RepID=A0A5B8HEP2_9GAMM|nr:HofP DNA utilization family protein [Dickeya poaceiphila]QDX28705.1 DUF2531 family protein [Dickeya poaceiphila]
MNGWQRGVLWLGLLLGTVRAETMRDPFQPLSEVSCDSGQLPDKWQLKGMVGSSSQWVGWLAQAQTGWLRVRDGDVIPPGDWQVTRLDSTGATLSLTDGKARCERAEIHLEPPFHHKIYHKKE